MSIPAMFSRRPTVSPSGPPVGFAADGWPGWRHTGWKPRRLCAIFAGVFAFSTACPADIFTAAFGFPGEVAISADGFSAGGHAIELSLGFATDHAMNLTVIENTGRNFIEGNFSTLAQGQSVELGHGGKTYRFVANYFGGDGNDLVLQWTATRLVGWGSNSYGQLGTGDPGNRDLAAAVTPSPVLAGQTVTGVATGIAHSLALRADGKLIAWGSNSHGALGDSTTTDRFEPVAVNQAGALAGRTVVAVDAGFGFSVALTSDGQVFCWGFNDSGQLGSGSSIIAGSPVPVSVSTSGLLAGRTVVAISAGYSHVLALCADGTLATWGENSFHQLGDGTTTSTNVPVAVDASGALAGKSVIAIAAGGTHNLALCADGTLVSWGDNGSGKLGDGTTVSSAVPIDISAKGVLAGRQVVKIAAGSAHSLAACSDATLAGWGFDGSGRLGTGTGIDQLLPSEVDRMEMPAGITVRRLGASAQNSMAYLADGSVFTWGFHLEGQLGYGSDEPGYIPLPVSTEPLAEGEVFLDAKSGMNSAHTLAIVAVPQVPRIRVFRDSVSLTARAGTCNFGSAAADGQIPMTLDLQNPGLVPLGISGIAIEGRDAADFSFAPPISFEIPAGGSVPLSLTFAAGPGLERRAMLRISTDDPSLPEFTSRLSATVRGTLDAVWSGPDDIPLTVEGFSAAGSTVNLGLAHAPATGATLKLIEHLGGGVIEGVFDNLAQGQLVVLVHEGVTYRFIADYFGGDGNDLVLRWAETRMLAWGYNHEFQLGDGSQSDRTLPHAVELQGGGEVMKAYTGWSGSFALLADGSLRAWGNNSGGQLGIGSTVTPQPVPTPVDASGILAGKKVTAVSAGHEFTVALCDDGTLAAWGWNDEGNLGPSATGPFSASPLEMPPTGALAGKRVVAIATGQLHSLALCSDGTIAAWGGNWQGSLGNGGSFSQSTPVAVSTRGILAGKRVIAIAAGNGHSLALCDDGTLAAWGSNADGQLGDGTDTHRRVPVAVDRAGVLAGRTVVAIAAGFAHSLALCADGTIVGWGSNSGGQLGLEGSGVRLLPVVVPATGALADRTVTGIAAYRTGSLARTDDGEWVVWGSNISGQHGVGFTASFSSPTPVRVSTSTLPAGGRFAEISDSCLAGHLLGIAAVPPDPEMEVQDAGGSLMVSGSSSVEFPASLEGASPNLPFNMRNLRGGPLVVSGITFSGPHAADFRVSRPALGAVGAGSGTPFQIAFTPGGPGSREAVMHIESNDPAAPFTIALSGEADDETLLHAAYSDGTEVPLSTHGFTATGKQVTITLAIAPSVGTRLAVIENTGPGRIDGAFENLSHGQEIELDHEGRAYSFVADYFGGDGNDLVLVPARGRLLSWGDNASGGLGNGGSQNGLMPAAVDSRGVLRGKTVLSIATGSSHSLAVCSDGTIAAWGQNNSGQLGNGTNISSGVPVAVDPSGVLAGRRVVAVAAGSAFSLALCADGRVAAWGLNSSGQLGNGTTNSSSTPVLVDDSDVLAGRMVTAIAAGSLHTLALCADGGLVAWGNNSWGRLGNGSTIQSNTPVAVDQAGILTGKQVVDIAAGAGHSMALCGDGTLAVWGVNSDGQLGTGTSIFSTVPIPVSTADALGGKIVTRIAAGGNHSLALSRDGEIFTWGNNGQLQLGAGGIGLSRIPIRVDAAGALLGRNIVAIGAGSVHSFAHIDDGSIVTWGGNSSGQLGNNATGSSAVPVLVDTNLTVPGARFILAGGGSSSTHHLAVVAEPPAPKILVEQPEGMELISGRDGISFPLLDVGGTGSRNITVRNAGSAPLADFSFVIEGPAAGDLQVAFSPGLVLSPGASHIFEVGFSPQTGGPRLATLRIFSNDPLEPVFELSLSGAGRGEMNLVVGDPANPGADFDSFAATGSTLLLSLDRRPPPGGLLTVVRVRGPGFIEGEFDNLGHGDPLILSLDGREFRYVANYHGGSGNDLVLHPAGARALAWGANGSGRLGTGNTTAQPLPVETLTGGLLEGRTITSMAAGESHSLALCADGLMVSWGRNSDGQLGRGSFTSSTSPVAVSSSAGALVGKRVVAIAAGVAHSLALCSDGTAVTWGGNFSWQLGSGGGPRTNLPVAVSTNGVLAGKSVVAIAAGANHNLALCSDGILVAWGENGSGQLGNGSSTLRNVPVAVNQSGVLAGKRIVAIATGANHSLALCADGAIAAWGSNSGGALGDGTMTSRPIPVLVHSGGVLAGRRPISIAAGNNFSLALCEDGFLASWGANNGGKLGDGTTTSRTTPVAVNTSGVLDGATILGISAGADHVMATVADGTVADWGLNSSGQIGNGGPGQSSIPVLVSTTSPPPGGAFVSTAVNSPAASHSLAMQVETPREFFEIWAAAQGLDGSPGRAGGFGDDPDGDGVANGLEWILQGDPKSQDASKLITTSGSDLSGLKLVFRRVSDSLGANLQLEWDTDFTDGFANRLTIGRTGVAGTALAPSVEIDVPVPGMATLMIPAANAPEERIFARLRAASP